MGRIVRIRRLPTRHRVPRYHRKYRCGQCAFVYPEHLMAETEGRKRCIPCYGEDGDR